jgi:alanyl-tRNA synthetase
MLGNFSFGDYFKKEAIEWGWDLLIHEWGLPAEKMWITIYLDDDDAFHLWRKIGIPEDRIVRLGKKDNFWEMGNTGPCGPCSEIHIDLGQSMCDKQDVPGHKCAVNAGCSRFIELWNLVFIQYNRDDEGKLSPLTARYIDTGAGLERVAAAFRINGAIMIRIVKLVLLTVAFAI